MFVFVISCVLILNYSHIECNDVLTIKLVFYDNENKTWKVNLPSRVDTFARATKKSMLYDLGKAARIKQVQVHPHTSVVTIQVFRIGPETLSVDDCMPKQNKTNECGSISRWINVTGEHKIIVVRGTYLYSENFVGCYSTLETLKSRAYHAATKDLPECYNRCLYKTSSYSIFMEGNCYCMDTLFGFERLDTEQCMLCQDKITYCGSPEKLPIYAHNLEVKRRSDSDVPCYDDFTKCFSGCESGTFGSNCEFRNCLKKNGGCGENMLCLSYSIGTSVSGYCVCKNGLYINKDYECQDIDECENLLICKHKENSKCANYIGSYFCACLDGFEEPEETKEICKDINECLKSPCDKESTKCINDIGTYKCLCRDGFTSTTTAIHLCVDVDECRIGSKCKRESTTCINTIGSYRCDCKGGYQKNDEISCNDIDECASSYCDIMTTECLNEPGSYKCPCKNGFTNVISIKDRCIDIDECSERNMCDHISTICNNTVGNYTCECKAGYLRQNSYICKDIDECALSICDITTTSCINKQGSYSCPCKKGFINIISTKHRCIDIDECSERNMCDLRSTICNNTLGSYYCYCRNGYQRQTLYICQDIDECELNKCNELTSLCKNEIGSYDCLCKTGFMNTNTSSKVCIDINECGEVNRCDTGSTNCGNIPGSYICECKPGFLRNSSSRCEDKNECLEMQHTCGEKSICRNTIGSYECGCPAGTKTFVYGYLVDCQDIDECEEINSCDISKSVCINMIPSYLCQCLFGFVNVDNFTCGNGSVVRRSTTIDYDEDEDDEEEVWYDEVTTATAPGDESQTNFLSQYQNTIMVLAVIFLIILVGLRWFINMRKANIESAASTVTGNLSVKSATLSTMDI